MAAPTTIQPEVRPTRGKVRIDTAAPRNTQDDDTRLYVEAKRSGNTFSASLTFVVPGAKSQTSDDHVPIRDYFSVLADIWRRDTAAFSTFAQKQRHEAYRAIIALHERAIPYMLLDMRDNNAPWYIALEQITRESPPIPSGYPSNFWGEKEAWIRWGRAAGYNV